MWRNIKGASNIFAIIVALIAVAVGSVVGLAIVGQSYTIGSTLVVNANASDALNQTTWTIMDVWPLLGIVALALIAGAVLAALGIFGRSR